MQDTPRLSVVIPTYRRPELARACVDSVLAAVPLGCEVLLCEDGATGALVGWARGVSAVDPRFRFLELPHAGPAATRNAGWRASRGEVVAFIDDDCTAEPGWGVAILGHLDRHAEESGLEGQTLPAGPVPGPFFHSIESRGGQYLSCNLALRREVLEAHGGFDESFPYPAAEDLDLCWRILGAGGRIGYAPDALARHGVFQRTAAQRRRQTRFEASYYRLFAKHPARFADSARALRVARMIGFCPDGPPAPSEVLAYQLLFRASRAFALIRSDAPWWDRARGLWSELECAGLSLARFSECREAMRRVGPMAPR